MKARTRARKNSREKSPPQKTQTRWVEQTLKKMTLREKLGQMLMVSFFGGFAPAQGADYTRVLCEVEDNHVGGLIVGTARGPLGIRRSQVYPTAIILNELQRRAKIPLLVGADFESGTRMRLEEGTPYPSAMAIAATGEPRFAYTAGKSTAIEARAAGVHWIFAPDADVNNNPDNPIINVRSFGEDPKDVASYVAQFVRGVEENGALATAKHFPGHGNVSVDSHLSLAVVPGDRKELDGTELVPFRAAIRAGVSSIMPGHLAAPVFEPDAHVPATLSRKILTGLLRGEMKFRGLIITDALEMGGVTSLYPPGEVAVRAVEAGADVLLMPPVPDAAIAGLEDAVKSGRIPAKRIDESLRRILAAKARLRLNRNRLVDVARLHETFGCPEFEAQAQEIADRSVTLLRDSTRLLPLDPTRPLRVLLVALSADPDAVPGETLEPEIRPRVDSLSVMRADTRFTSAAMLRVPSPDSYDVAIAALFVRVADRKGNVGLPDDQRAVVNQLLVSGKPVVIASFGSPYLIERFPTAKTWLAEFSTNDVSQRAAARALFGQIGITGKIPVTVPGSAQRGAGLRVAANPMTLAPAAESMSDRLRPTYDLLDRAVTDGAFPGGVLAVGWNDELAIYPFGRLTRDAKATRVTSDTIYDVASLTKPIVTTTAAMLLVQQGQLDLDAPVTRYLPEFASATKPDPDPAWRARITIRMLLLHNSGLPWHRDFYKDAKGKPAVVARAMAEPLVCEPGKQIEYSDLGFILLGEIIERLTGESLDGFAQQSIFEPLAMGSSMFNPSRNLRARIAPTENDTSYRKRLLRGEVDDENAWAMGGVAGHGGLFSTAADIAVFAQMLLNGGIYAHSRLLARATIGQFTARQIIGDSAGAIGWDVPTEPSSSGRYFSRQSFGHLGFTGTSLWIDPSRRLLVILLTNRVNPTRANEKIRQVRPAVHDAVVEALGLASGQAAAR
ncbi:MAG: glycoside hydrolase family 3 N-terminal domain-containing protein [Candidatus Acidiferrales bacterium]|jgi:beta-glucosidase-like glycosyl hydrolase/CubicO group peptidase (beta-lactamase class C family)